MKNTSEYVLITGATSGIGYELAKLFAQDGYNLITVARTASELDVQAELFKSEYGVDVISFPKDLFGREEAFALADELDEKGLEIRILVNNAAQGEYGLFKDTDIERELDIIELNISSLVILTKHFLKKMVAKGDGKILNVASVASKLPGPWQSVYHATKAFVLSFTEAITEETKDSGITITALMPGVTDTDFFNKADMNASKAVQDKDAMADPADVAKDGYKALMSGKGKVVSGFQNKVQVSMSNLTPDSLVAHQVNEQQKPAE